MDEKVMVSTNALNKMRDKFKDVNLGAKLAKQVVKREAAPEVTEAKAEEHLAKIELAAASIPAATLSDATNQHFFDLWDKYYPIMVNLLGWASWILPGDKLKMIKSLLAIVNNEVIPLLKKILKEIQAA